MIRAQYAGERLGQGKDRHRHQQEADAVEQIAGAEGEPFGAGGRVDTNGGEHDAKQGHHHRLEKLPPIGERGDGGEPHDHQREIIRRPEAQRHLGQQRRRHHQEYRRQGTAGKRGISGQRQRLAGLPFARQGIAIERGRHGTGHPRRIDQNRRGGAAKNRTVVHSGHEDHAVGRVDTVGHRNHQGDGGDRPQPWQHANKGAHQAPHHYVEDALPAQRRGQTGQHAFYHGLSSTACPAPGKSPAHGS